MRGIAAVWVIFVAALGLLPISAIGGAPTCFPICPDINQCRAAAKWSATGTIARVLPQRRVSPYPTDAPDDYFEITFSVLRFEHGGDPNVKEIKLIGGQCRGPAPKPDEDITGLYRFIGFDDPAKPASIYFSFEKLDWKESTKQHMLSWF